MPSRMERYADVQQTRTAKNKSLYDQIYEEKEYTNVEGIVKTPVAGNIDIEKIKEIIRNREEKNKPQERRVRQTPIIKEAEEEEEIKNYDIKEVLTKAKDERPEEQVSHHSLKNVEFNILKGLKINKDNYEEQDEELKELINTITNTSMLNKIGDKELSLDLLDDLKSTNNTVIGSSDAIRKVLTEEKKQQEEEEEMDDSFYTKSMNLSEDLEGLELKKGNSKTNKLLVKIFLITSIVVVAAVGVVIISMLLKK